MTGYMNKNPRGVIFLAKFLFYVRKIIAPHVITLHSKTSDDIKTRVYINIHLNKNKSYLKEKL